MKKAKPVKAWAVVGKKYFLGEHRSPYSGVPWLFGTKEDAENNCYRGNRLARVEIREIK